MTLVDEYIRKHISIHTPAKGVTDGFQNVPDGVDISIHTPAKGVTHPDEKIKDAILISIHTPAKGVTNNKWQHYTRLIFQSTLPRRE